MAEEGGLGPVGQGARKEPVGQEWQACPSRQLLILVELKRQIGIDYTSACLNDLFQLTHHLTKSVVLHTN